MPLKFQKVKNWIQFITFEQKIAKNVEEIVLLKGNIPNLLH